ncbi:DNA damage-binding protein cmr1 [Penicillium macrosclerotiorum]|uniref:DNA damage-binding protein cmr1 n=1 Tax=Penicillium macrosclerotiorum TaxID=303699 RepID=UPI0025488CE5|nr:DNA damage-binding protein cmr1 [Penicillium macrosclerotiorum]KAJ5679695.1 DNA damage-binding protein cmr1 [Penicillium macrosclerotiorum]
MDSLEQQRLANIAERDALLKQMSLGVQSASLFNSPKTPGSSATKSKKKAAPKRIKEEEDSPLPRRQSSRLRGIAAESEVAKRKAEELYEAAKEVERAKKLRRTDSFTANDMFIAGQKITDEGLIGVDVVNKGVAEPYVRTFGDDEIQKTTDKDLKALREEMNGLSLWEEWDPQRIKITPERVYAMTFHPSESKPLIFAGDKMGHLGVFDASQNKPEVGEDDEEDDPDPVLTTLKPHTRTISAMTIHPLNPTRLYTASYDSSIRELDLEKTKSVEKFAPKSTKIDEALSGVDMAADDPHTLYWTTLNGAFGRYDMRTSLSESTVSQWQLSEKKIGGFTLCPSQPHYLATASLDRFMRLWDLRKLSFDDPVPVAEHESRLSVSHAAFNAAGHIATSSYDDTLKIYDVGAKGMSSWKPGHNLSDKEFRPDTVVRHNCQTGRWVTILRPQWQLNPQSHIQRFCIGNMNRFVDIYSASGDQLAQLGGDGITAVPAVAVFHRSKNWVVGGTASGKVCLWL